MGIYQRVQKIKVVLKMVILSCKRKTKRNKTVRIAPIAFYDYDPENKLTGRRSTKRYKLSLDKMTEVNHKSHV